MGPTELLALGDTATWWFSLKNSALQGTSDQKLTGPELLSALLRTGGLTARDRARGLSKWYQACLEQQFRNKLHLGA